MDGTDLRALTVALIKSDMNPSLIPCSLVNASCISARNFITALMSHSLNVVRIAAVCWAITNCAAILRRNGDIRLRTIRLPSLLATGSEGSLDTDAAGLDATDNAAE